MLTPTTPGAGPTLQPGERGLMSAVVEAEPVDDGAVARQTEDARARIARLRQAASRCRSRQSRSQAAERRRVRARPCRNRLQFQRGLAATGPRSATQRGKRRRVRRGRKYAELQRLERQFMRFFRRKQARVRAVHNRTAFFSMPRIPQAASARRQSPSCKRMHRCERSSVSSAAYRCGKCIAAARGLPPQLARQAARVSNLDQHEIVVCRGSAWRACPQVARASTSG